MPIKRVNLVIVAQGEPRSGKTTMLNTIAEHLKAVGYQIDDSGANKEHHILASYPITVEDNQPAPTTVFTPAKK